MAYYGRRITSGDTDMGDVGANEQRACVFDPMPEHGWGHSFHWYGGKPTGQAGNPTIKPAIWETNASMNPTTRLAYHAGFTTSKQMSYGGDGQAYEAPVANVNASKSPGSNAVAMWSGKRYALGIVAASYPARHGMTAAGNIAGDNEQFYDRSGVSTPTDPNGYTSAHVEGWLSMAMEYQPNREPTAAATSPSGTVNTTTPTFSGSFTDADTIYGDKMTKYQIQVYRSSDNALMWDSGQISASSSEQSAGSFSRAYGGSALSAGVTYKWRCRVADWFGTWSAWTAYTTFTINAGGSVTLTTPAGKQETRQPGPITGTWTHQSGLGTNAVETRIRDSTGAVLKTSPTLAKSIANGGAISVTWTEAFGSTYFLSWGSSYTIEMRARDTGNLWSDWASIAITTNAAPSIPSNLSPANSQASSSRPLLVCKCTDPDDTPATGLVVKARVKDNNGNVIATRAMSLRAGTTDTWEYQTTASDLASFGTYKWDAYAGDGTLWSGEQAAEASAVTSAEATFVYASGPQITIVSPTEGQTLTTGTPLYDWSVTFSGATQVSYQLLVYRASDNALIYDSGVVNNTSASEHAQPSGYLRDGVTYYLKVRVRDSNNQVGESAARTFTLDYVEPPAPANFRASPEYAQFDGVPSAIRLTWDASTEAGFTEYIIGRRETGQGEEDELILARISAASETVFVDYLPASETEYTYSIRQSTVQGLDTTTSARAESQASVALEHVVLCDAREGGTYRVGLHLDSERSFDHHDDLVLEQPWGEAEPFALFGTASYQTFGGTFTLATDELATARAFIEALRALKARRSTLCYRDERGRRFFAVISKFSEKDRRVGHYTAEIELTEVAHDEGVE